MLQEEMHCSIGAVAVLLLLLLVILLLCRFGRFCSANKAQQLDSLARNEPNKL